MMLNTRSVCLGAPAHIQGRRNVCAQAIRSTPVSRRRHKWVAALVHHDPRCHSHTPREVWERPMFVTFVRLARADTEIDYRGVLPS
jgi:hypothetical protein